jgi:hypothetical protein
MRELEVKHLGGTPGFLEDIEIRAFQVEHGDGADEEDKELSRIIAHAIVK